MSENTADFFAACWQEATRHSPWRKRRLQGRDPVARWNRMAADFAERTSECQSRDHRQDIIAWLGENDALSAGMEVLDIGSGSGNWAVPMAARCSRLVALEPAGAMLEILSSRVREAGIENITSHQVTWQEVDLDALRWRGRFDLVFASMTPGVDGPRRLPGLRPLTIPFLSFPDSLGGRSPIVFLTRQHILLFCRCCDNSLRFILIFP